MISLSSSRPGYFFLISVLCLGVMSLAALGYLLLFSLGTLKSSVTLNHSRQAYFITSSCSERVLQNLWNDPSYSGEELLVLYGGQCHIYPIGGSGNEHRSICVEGNVEETIRRFQIVLQRILPSIQVESWQEVDHCSTLSL
ncbi:MAG: hypothetical protein WCG83_06865 [Candidatus Peregrinibacteria bacterium]